MKQLISILSFLLLAFAGYSQSVQIKDGAILAAFSVSDSTKVYFSQGNLQYQASTKTWRFAEHQYDTIGADNKNINETNEGYIDLFGWGTSGYNGKNPYMTSEAPIDYGVNGHPYTDITATNYDWGANNAISNGGNTVGMWRTLTREEWSYVFSQRTDAGALKGLATVNGVNGLILLPDNWTMPGGITFNSGMKGFSNNTYSTSEWTKMESNGAVFLPAAGYRSGSGVDDVGSDGYYWSSSANYIDYAYYLGFFGDDARMYDDYRDLGQSVRLVRDVN